MTKLWILAASLLWVGAAASAQPQDPSGKWEYNGDYPVSAWREGREGTTGFIITYDWRGKITDCQIDSSSGHADLDVAACDLLFRRGKFSKRKKGSPPLTYRNRIVWKIPAGSLPPEPAK